MSDAGVKDGRLVSGDGPAPYCDRKERRCSGHVARVEGYGAGDPSGTPGASVPTVDARDAPHRSPTPPLPGSAIDGYAPMTVVDQARRALVSTAAQPGIHALPG